MLVRYGLFLKPSKTVMGSRRNFSKINMEEIILAYEALNWKIEDIEPALNMWKKLGSILTAGK